MALHYTQPYHVAGMAVYRCTCGESVIMKTEKVTSGSRTGCRNCDPTMNPVPERRSYHPNSADFEAGNKFGCITLTGNFTYEPSKKQNKLFRMYEGTCTCGHVGAYKTYQLRDMPQNCIHKQPRHRKLQAGNTLGIYTVIGIKGLHTTGNYLYNFRCTKCNHEFYAMRHELRKLNKCVCSQRKTTCLKPGEIYGIYKVIRKIPYIPGVKKTLYEVECTICGKITQIESSNIKRGVRRCQHQTITK